MLTSDLQPIDSSTTGSIEETLALARKWSDRLRGRNLGLIGELGAGKTAFVRGLVAALEGDPNEVRSPTFTLMNIYATTPLFYHFDLFRLDNAFDLDSIGYFEFMESPGTCAVEWPDKVPQSMEVLDFIVKITESNPSLRQFKLFKV